MSDGTPWRPIVHVRDVCSAFIAGIEAPKNLISGRAFNVGVHNGNFTVREIAEAAQRAVPGCDLVFTGEHGSDARTYKVSFSRILNELKDYFKPKWNLDKGGEELVAFFNKINFNEAQFRGRDTIRLKQLKYGIENNFIGSNLKFVI
jgi:nucleoside-diphosphate-sugar epimerase